MGMCVCIGVAEGVGVSMNGTWVSVHIYGRARVGEGKD